RETLERELGEPGPDRIWYVGDAFAAGWTLEEVHHFTKIDPWFLVQIEEIVKIELALEKTSLQAIDADTFPGPKKKALSDRGLAKRLKTNVKAVRQRRIAENNRPVYKRDDTCAAEFANDTAYLYSTYEGHDKGECE